MSGWQRIGIILSIIWLLVGGWWGRTLIFDYVGWKTSAQLDLCVARNKAQFGENGPYEKIWTPCWAEHTSNFTKNAEGHWWTTLAFALIPIPFGWLIGWGLIATSRWVKRGFQQATN